MSRLEQWKGNVWKLCRAISPALEHRLRFHFSRTYADNWGYRTRLARACPDNALIPRVPDAGKVVGDFQILHNGLRVVSGSYYGEGATSLFRKNRGVHEPQEERVFQEVLKSMRPGGLIIELGAYWAFYSMWFCKEVPQARAYLVEPMAQNLDFGRKNFQANSMSGHFTQAYAGRESGRAADGVPIICVDDFVTQHGIERVDILHSDIQGAEVDMLHGAQKTIESGQIGWFFVSTHNEELHAACAQFLKSRSIEIVASISMVDSFSVDGILVGRAAHAPAIPPIALSRRSRR